MELYTDLVSLPVSWLSCKVFDVTIVVNLVKDTHNLSILSLQLPVNLYLFQNKMFLALAGVAQWIEGRPAGLRTKGSLVRFPVRAYAWVAGQVPGWG